MNRNPYHRLLVLAAWLGAFTLAGPVRAADPPSILVASTTSTQDSGLFEHLLPRFKARTGIEVKVVAQGTGQALDTGRRGDADVVLVHDPEAEVRFVAEGFGVRRVPVMHNDFVLVGPRQDPAGIRGLRDAVLALQRIHSRGAVFISRGDRSGTHQSELRLWQSAGLSPDPARHAWYRSVGQGMGAALNMASASNAYLLADRATWARFGNKAELQLLVEGDQRLFNPYGVILVNPLRHPHVKAKQGQQFIDYLISPQGQTDIAAYRVAGEQLFHPDAGQL